MPPSAVHVVTPAVPVIVHKPFELAIVGKAVVEGGFVPVTVAVNVIDPPTVGVALFTTNVAVIPYVASPEMVHPAATKVARATAPAWL